MDVNKIKALFPMYTKHPDLIYLDSSATSLKPQYVLDKMNEYYSDYGVNIHRGVYNLSYIATDKYDEARQNIASFLNADFQEIVFTKNVTEALNKAALMFSEFLSPGDEVITTELEHHSSMLPWQVISKNKKLKLTYLPLTKEGRITVENFKKIITNKTRIIALTYVSNTMGYMTDIKEITKIAHEHNIVVIVDAAQAVPHLKIDVKDLDCDFLAFSGHKMFGPTGIGVLYGKKALLKKLTPIDFGGDMNEDVDLYDVEIKDIPYRFEAGTPPIAEAIGLSAAVDFIKSIGYENIHMHEIALLNYAHAKLKQVKGITVYNWTSDIGLINFNIDNVHPHDAATLFDKNNIAIRAGHHCAQLVSKLLKCNGTLRASFYIYNDRNDVDAFVRTIEETVSFFSQF